MADAEKQNTHDALIKLDQKFIEQMEDNSILLVADKIGARLHGKLRGCTIGEMGLMFGASLSTIMRQIEQLEENIRAEHGEEHAAKFRANVVAANKPHYQAARIRMLPGNDPS